MTYKEKLKNPLWQKKKNNILTRDNYTCQNSACGTKTVNLQVHHKIYIEGINPWDYPDDMLTTLCEPCHSKKTGREELEKHLSNTFKSNGFLVSDLLALSCILETNKRFTEILLNILRKAQNG